MKTIRHNFSLTELLVVIAVIAILAGMLVPVLSSVYESSKATAAEQEMSALAAAISQMIAKDKSIFNEMDNGYNKNNNSVPTAWQEMSENETDEGFNNFYDYLKNKGYASEKDIIRVSTGNKEKGFGDAWGFAYRFICERQNGYVKIWSCGPDGKFCASGASSNWEFNPERENKSSSDYIEDDVFVKVSF